MRKSENSGNFSPPTEYEFLNAKGIRVEFERLKSGIEENAINVKEIIQSTLPELARMQSLLSQRGTKRRKVLKQAGMPSWTEFAYEYSKKVGYSVRQLRNFINEFRGQTSAVKKPAKLKLNLGAMFEGLFDFMRFYGDAIPSDLWKACANIKDALDGKIDQAAWSENHKAILELAKMNSLNSRDEAAAVPALGLPAAESEPEPTPGSAGLKMQECSHQPLSTAQLEGDNNRQTKNKSNNKKKKVAKRHNKDAKDEVELDGCARQGQLDPATFGDTFIASPDPISSQVIA